MKIDKRKSFRSPEVPSFLGGVKISPEFNYIDIETTEFELAALIRCVETKFLAMFADGLLSGTVHTCVGQEFTALAVIQNLSDSDWVTSNHRCHGHFIAKTGLWKELIAELLGDEAGVCRGIGSSQHLFVPGFLSNGTQGSLLPVGTGIASHLKKTSEENIVVSYIGEGTLGEGVTYETLNLASVFSTPQLFVCENNFYSQSTPQASAVAGDICSRAASFGIKVFETNIWDLSDLYAISQAAVDYVRIHRMPAFLLIKCYRLNAHSKGDDDRDAKEVDFFETIDPLSRWLAIPKHAQSYRNIEGRVDQFVDEILGKGISVWDFQQYSSSTVLRQTSVKKQEFTNERMLMAAALNDGYKQQLLEKDAFFVGEDIADPYGGAFKITKGFSALRKTQVFSTPISEAALTGFGIGRSIMGDNVFCEIMFGDFIVNACDQIINNACKFHYMYAGKVSCPLRIRVPMGGGRGYGPTHSQSLEKMFFGMENLTVIAPTSLRDPRPMLEFCDQISSPLLIVENKVDYGRRIPETGGELIFEEIGGPAGTISIRPKQGDCGLTIVAYGGVARQIFDCYEELFKKLDERIHLLVPQVICPIPLSHFERSIFRTGKLLVVEEGISDFGWSSELVTQLVKKGMKMKVDVVGAHSVSIPSPRPLEEIALPSVGRILNAAMRLING